MVKRSRSVLQRMPLRRRKTKKVNASAASKFTKDRLSNRLLLGMSKTTTLSYVDYFNLNPGIGLPATYIFSANGLFDPNITGVGHQPRGYDQLKSLFDHYTVTSATIKVVACGPGGQTSTFPLVFGVLLSDDNAVESDQIHALEAKKSAWTFLPANDESRTLYLDFEAKEFFGMSFKDASYKGSINANPDDQAFFQIFVEPTSAVDAAAVQVCVEIIYHVTWTEPNNVQIS